MDALADGLQNLYVDGSGTAIVAIVLVTYDAIRTLGFREGQGGFCDAWNNVARVKGKYGRVYVDIVRIKDFWED